MATVLQLRRGNTATMQAFTGAVGEIVVNTDTDTIHVHDGVITGGQPLQKAQKMIRVDFGPNATYEVYGTISDPYAIANSTYVTAVSMFCSGAASNGSVTTAYYGDENEFDGFNCAAYVTSNGTINYYITAYPGPVSNTRIFNYILS
jgi:Major tropism determinant N-terminal domain